jgi:hypothetical protein
MAGDPHTAALLVGLGVDELSVSCYDLPRVKAAVRSIRADAVSAVAKEALASASAGPVRALVREKIDALMPSYLSLDRDALEAEQAAAAAPVAAPAAKRASRAPTRQMPRPPAKQGSKEGSKSAARRVR